jgi:hypothetical protein
MKISIWYLLFIPAALLAGIAGGVYLALMPLGPRLNVQRALLPGDYTQYWEYVKIAAVVAMVEGAAVVGLLAAILHRLRKVAG